MVDPIYELLNSIGFTHPLHPAITHLPMGMVMGAFLFGLASLKYPFLARTAYHCIALGLIFVLPTMLLGFMDWLHFYQGEWLTPIIVKIILAFVLSALMLLALAMGRKSNANPQLMLIIYGLCLLTAIGLGFSGGEIQYG